MGLIGDRATAGGAGIGLMGDAATAGGAGIGLMGDAATAGGGGMGLMGEAVKVLLTAETGAVAVTWTVEAIAIETNIAKAALTIRKGVTRTRLFLCIEFAPKFPCRGRLTQIV